MTYTAYELTVGDALTEVQNLCHHAARNSGAFSASTIPTLSAVEQWITTSYYWIGGVLLRSGLSRTQTAPEVLGILQQLNVYDACMKVEMSLPVESSSGEPNERFKFFEERRNELMEQLMDGTLAGLGAVTQSTGLRTPIVTGTSRARKALLNEDTDATQHRVKREQFTYPGSQQGTYDTDSLNAWSPQ